MKNVNKKSIKFGFKVLSILAFGLIFLPIARVNASVYPTYVLGGYSDDGESYEFGHFIWNDDNGGILGSGSISGSSTSNGNTNGINGNPVPKIDSISPRSVSDTNTRNIAISGRGFMQNSVVRINNSPRSFTFIDPSHLLVQVTASDIYTYQNDGGFFITVYNGTPGGGYSNAGYLTIKGVKSSGNTNRSGTNGGNYFNGTKNAGGNNGNNSSENADSYGNLSSNLIFGSGSVLPGGLVAWIILAIMIFVIVILTRKVFGGEERYHKTPLKHA